jgi:hypothetical protein
MILCQGKHRRSSEIYTVGIPIIVRIYGVPSWGISYPTCVGSLEGSGIDLGLCGREGDPWVAWLEGKEIWWIGIIVGIKLL